MKYSQQHKYTRRLFNKYKNVFYLLHYTIVALFKSKGSRINRLLLSFDGIFYTSKYTDMIGN